MKKIGDWFDQVCFLLFLILGLLIMPILIIYIDNKNQQDKELRIDYVNMTEIIENDIYKNEVTGYYYWLVDGDYVFIGTEDDFNE